MNGREIKIERFDTLPSTNDYAKTLRNGGQDTIVIAKAQSGGRGTKGRSFSSNAGGLYLTLLRFLTDFPAKDAFSIMQTAAVAVCETLKLYALEPKIKWPNDILVGGKKICGILIENTFSGAWVRDSLVGIGLNVNNALEEELCPIATSMRLETGKTLDLAEVESRLIDNLLRPADAEKYARYLSYVGERVTLLRGAERIDAKVLAVDERGNLVAQTKNGEEKFAAAEITLRHGE